MYGNNAISTTEYGGIFFQETYPEPEPIRDSVSMFGKISEMKINGAIKTTIPNGKIKNTLKLCGKITEQ